MIDSVTKFKSGGRDYPYVVEFERRNPESKESEGLTLHTGARPRPALIKKMGEVAKLALRYHGLGLLVEAVEKRHLTNDETLSRHLGHDIGFAFQEISWSYGENPGSRVGVVLTSAVRLAEIAQTSRVKITLPKVDQSEELVHVGEGKERRKVVAEDSLKNEYNAAVKELLLLVKAYADGETEQGTLFPRAEAPAAEQTQAAV